MRGGGGRASQAQTDLFQCFVLVPSQHQLLTLLTLRGCQKLVYWAGSPSGLTEVRGHLFVDPAVPRDLDGRLCFPPQSKAFEKTANQVKQKKRWENNRMKVAMVVVAVAVVAIIIGGIIYAVVSNAEQ